MEGFEKFTNDFHFESYPALSPARPEFNLRGKSVLITGGGYGIGPAIASSFASAGASRIAISGRTKSRLDSTAADLSATFPSTTFSTFAADVTDATAVAAMFTSFGAPDILVNNAGYMSTVEKLVDIADLRADWWRAFETNILGTATVTHTYLRQRAQEKPSSPGTVFALSTPAVHWGTALPGFSSYSASKAGQLRLMEMLGAEAGGEARFVTVNPGAVDTEMNIKSGLRGKIRLTDAELVADWLVWATRNADWLHGRFLWAGWDVEELERRKEEIRSGDLLTYAISGLPVQ